MRLPRKKIRNRAKLKPGKADAAKLTPPATFPGINHRIARDALPNHRCIDVHPVGQAKAAVMLPVPAREKATFTRFFFVRHFRSPVACVVTKLRTNHVFETSWLTSGKVGRHSETAAIGCRHPGAKLPDRPNPPRKRPRRPSKITSFSNRRAFCIPVKSCDSHRKSVRKSCELTPEERLIKKPTVIQEQ